ncbi:MAG: hypothetical protein AAF431_11485 [Pseudomonadota bacterium]
MKYITQKFTHPTLRAWHFVSPSAMDLVRLQNGGMVCVSQNPAYGAEDLDRT